jgi:hypothetical protein
MQARSVTVLCTVFGTAGSSGAVVDYSPFAEALQMTSASPGGFGALRMKLRLPMARARLPHPELSVLNGRVLVLNGRDCVYCGEVNEAAITLDATGEGVELVAMGGAEALVNDPSPPNTISK